MSRSGAFCPQCGAELDPGAGHVATDPTANREARLCSSCFRDRLELVSLPEAITLRLCTQCGAIHEEGTWTDTEADYTDVAIERIADALAVHRDARDVEWGVEPIQRGPNELEVRVQVTATVAAAATTETHDVEVRIARETCERCGRIAGDSYAGTVQVRAADRTPSDTETDRALEIAHEVVEEMAATGDREAFVAGVDERPEGLDIRVSTTKIGAKVATRVTEELGGDYRTSETLVTEDEDGQGVYRVAYAIRLPRVKAGDIVAGDGEPVLVTRGVERVEGRALASGETTEVEGEPPVIGSVQDLEETTFVSVIDDRSVQVLDPDTHQPRTIPRPHDLPDHPETVSVFKHANGLYVVPADVIDD